MLADVSDGSLRSRTLGTYLELPRRDALEVVRSIVGASPKIGRNEWFFILGLGAYRRHLVDFATRRRPPPRTDLGRTREDGGG